MGIASIILCFSLLQVNTTNFDKFNTLLKEGKLDEAKIVIDNWGEQKESDPQYYICCFNYFMNKAITQGYVIQVNPPSDREKIILTLKDPNTGSVKGFMVATIVYDKATANTAITFIKEGIQKFPDHYEMRFGLLWALKELKDFDQYIGELEDALKYFSDKKLTYIFWNNNKKISDPDGFIIEKIQDILHEFVNNDEIYSNQKFLNNYIDLMIKYYPDNKYGYANKGFMYFNNKEYDKALEYYFKAYEIDKEDLLVLFNIGFIYKQKGNYDCAKTFFEKIITIGVNEYYINRASEELKNLASKSQ
ncbi:MAG: hypothetical protein AB1444_09565 [Spirochaetota bacterium]